MTMDRLSPPPSPRGGAAQSASPLPAIPPTPADQVGSWVCGRGRRQNKPVRTKPPRPAAAPTSSMGVIGPVTVVRANIYGVENGVTPEIGTEAG